MYIFAGPDWTVGVWASKAVKLTELLEDTGSGVHVYSEHRLLLWQTSMWYLQPGTKLQSQTKWVSVYCFLWADWSG